MFAGLLKVVSTFQYHALDTDGWPLWQWSITTGARACTVYHETEPTTYPHIQIALNWGPLAQVCEVSLSLISYYG